MIRGLPTLLSRIDWLLLSCAVPPKEKTSLVLVFFIFAYNKTMKKQIAIYVVTVALVFGIATPASAQHCTTQKGDSMWRIAKEYHVLFHELLKLNRHYPNQNLIHKGDKIELPDGSQGTGTNDGSNDDNITSNNQTPNASTTNEYASEVLRLVNIERNKQGVKALTLSGKLTSIANTKAKDMATSRYFDHNSPNYGSPFEMLQRFGVNYKTAGENIAAGQRTPKQVMESWMNSSGHRANILNSSYKELGVGFFSGGSYDTYWVQIFVG